MIANEKRKLQQAFILDVQSAEDAEDYAYKLVQDIIANANDNYTGTLAAKLKGITEVSQLKGEQQAIVYSLAREAIRKVVELIT